MIYFQNLRAPGKYKVYAVTDNNANGISVFRDCSGDIDTGFIDWKLSELEELIKTDGMKHFRITRKKAEQLMGNRKRFREIINNVRLGRFDALQFS